MVLIPDHLTWILRLRFGPHNNALPLLQRKHVLMLAAFTLFGFGGLGLFVIRNFLGLSLTEALSGQTPFWFQGTVGVLYGLLAASTGWTIIRMPFMDPVRRFYGRLFGDIPLGFFDIVLVSICAGVGEELLFRGGLQPYLGLWLTSFLFVLLHGYINPMNWRLTIYGLFMVLVIAGMGKIYDNVGPIAAMIAHTVIDIYLLRVMKLDGSASA